MRRAPLVVAALACAAGAVWVQAASTGGGAAALLPDLRPSAPFEADVMNDRGRRLLIFPSALENVGDGPLIVVGSRPSRRHKTMRASQTVRYSDGSTRRYTGAGRLHYQKSSDHSHWHYMRAMTYELRTEDGELIGPDRKTGFCLGDRHRIADGGRPGRPRPAEFATDCGKGKPGLLRLTEGISVGWYDNYSAYLEGQYIDITGLRRGRYVLVFRTNRSRNLRETDYSNNAASALIQLPREGDGPAVRIVERCGDRADCDATDG